jgi:hypothetical protein
MPDFSFGNIWNQLNRNPYAEWDAQKTPPGDIELPNPAEQGIAGKTRLIPPHERSWMEAIKDPTKPVRDYFHNQADDKYGPSDTPLPTDALGLFSQDFSPEGGNPLEHGINPHTGEAAISMVPRELLKKRAQEIGDAAATNFRNYPNLQKVVEDMADKHPYIVGNLSRIVPSRQKRNLASFAYYNEPYNAETLRGLINDPQAMLKHPDQKIQNKAARLISNATDAESRIKYLGDEFHGVMPHITIGGSQEGEPIAKNYSTMRHELSHANDYIYRPGDKGESFPGDDARYWTSTGEVRARAVERNFGRDMGINDANKTRAVPFNDFTPEELGMLSSDDQAIFHELNAARERYGDKIAAELAYGSGWAEKYAGRGAGGRILTPPAKARNVKNARNIAANTYGHYFSPRTGPGGVVLKPKLQLPEKFDIHGISQGQYPITDIMGNLFRY